MSVGGLVATLIATGHWGWSMSEPRRIDRMRAMNGMNRGIAHSAASTVQSAADELPPEAAALQRMVDSFPVGVRAELGADGEDDDGEEYTFGGDDSNVDYQRMADQGPVSPRPISTLAPARKQLTPLEQARKHREESLQLARDLRAYRAVVEQRISDAEQELKDIATALESLPAEVESE